MARKRERHTPEDPRDLNGPNNPGAPYRPSRRPDWKEVFINHLQVNPNVGRACKAAGVARATAYKARELHPDFKALWDDALENGVDNLEESLYARAMDLDSKTGVTAAIFLLKAKRYNRRSMDQPKEIEDEVRQEEEVIMGWGGTDAGKDMSFPDDDDWETHVKGGDPTSDPQDHLSGETLAGEHSESENTSGI